MDRRRIKAPYRTPRSLKQLVNDPRVESVYRDSDGLWVELRDGWKNTYDEPRGSLHGIHESNLKDAIVRMPYVQACNCEECVSRLARKGM